MALSKTLALETSLSHCLTALELAQKQKVKKVQLQQLANQTLSGHPDKSPAPLTYALATDNLEAVEQLLNADATINLSDYKILNKKIQAHEKIKKKYGLLAPNFTTQSMSKLIKTRLQTDTMKRWRKRLWPLGLFLIPMLAIFSLPGAWNQIMYLTEQLGLRYILPGVFFLILALKFPVTALIGRIRRNHRAKRGQPIIHDAKSPRHQFKQLMKKNPKSHSKKAFTTNSLLYFAYAIMAIASTVLAPTILTWASKIGSTIVTKLGLTILGYAGAGLFALADLIFAIKYARKLHHVKQARQQDLTKLQTLIKTTQQKIKTSQNLNDKQTLQTELTELKKLQLQTRAYYDAKSQNFSRKVKFAMGSATIMSIWAVSPFILPLLVTAALATPIGYGIIGICFIAWIGLSIIRNKKNSNAKRKVAIENQKTCETLDAPLQTSLQASDINAPSPAPTARASVNRNPNVNSAAQAPHYAGGKTYLWHNAADERPSNPYGAAPANLKQRPMGRPMGRRAY